jgi:hypothetical protein
MDPAQTQQRIGSSPVASTGDPYNLQQDQEMATVAVKVEELPLDKKIQFL